MNSQADIPIKRREDYTIVWVCALPIEQTAAMAMLDKTHADLLKTENDPNAYTLGSVGAHNIVIACLPDGRYGNNPAATVAAWMIASFPRVRFGLLVGIGGGIPPKVRLGDVVVSRPGNAYPGVVQWDLGKAESDGKLKHTGSLNNPPTELSTAVSKLRSHHQINGSRIRDFLDHVEQRYPRLEPRYTRAPSLSHSAFHLSDAESYPWTWTTILSMFWQAFSTVLQYLLGTLTFRVMLRNAEHKDTSNIARTAVSEASDEIAIHYGLIASGNSVVKDAQLRDRINEHFYGHVLCVEMEAAGLMDNFPCLIVRGICDYADARKDDTWQEYAATVAAAHGKEILLALQVQDVERMNSIEPFLKGLSQKFESIVGTTQNIYSLQLGDHERTILKWLTPLEPGKIQSDYVAKTLPGTGQWLLHDVKFREWEKKTGETLFCPGIPGAGKTFLASIVIQYLERVMKGRNVGIAYAYCSSQPEYEQTARRILASLLEQVSRRLPVFPESVKSLHRSCEITGLWPTLEEITNTLQVTAGSFDQIFIIIDALDEYQEDGRQEDSRERLLDEVFDLQDKAGINILATSRFIPAVTDKFRGKPTLEIRARDQDIMEFIDQNMSRLPTFIRKYPQLKENVRDWILDSVDGMFLVADLLLNSLIDKVTPQTVFDALKQLPIDESVYDFAYDRAMSRIEGQLRGHRKLAKEAISFIAFSKRPLNPQELQYALAASVGTKNFNQSELPDLDDIVRTCVGLVTIDEHRNVIRLAHYTTQEYLNEHREKWFHGADTDIMRACITSLSFGLSTRALYDNLWHPFFHYSMHYWGDHARECPSLGPEIAKILEDWGMVHMLSCYLMNDRKVTMHFPRRSHVTRKHTGFSGLHLAAFFGIISAIKALGGKIDVELKDAWGRTALSYASERGHRAAVRLLLDSCGAEDRVTGSFKRSAILYAARNGHGHIVEDILSSKRYDLGYREELFREIIRWKKQDPIQLQGIPRRRWASQSKEIRRWNSIQTGYEFLFDAMTQEGVVNISDLDPNGSTLSLPVCLLDPSQITPKRLHDNKVIFNVMDYRSRKSLWEIITKRHLDGVAILTDKDLSTDGEFGQTLGLLLEGAVWMNGEAIVTALLERGANPNTRCSEHTPLALAAVLGHEDIVSMLLSRGACLDTASKKGQTPLACAAIGGRESIVKGLLEKGADPNARDDSGQTPLSLAASQGSLLVVLALLESPKIDLGIQDTRGFRPISWATTNLCADVVGPLLEASKLILETESQGHDQWLLSASWLGQEKVVQRLLDAGRADVNAQNPDGATPLTLAAKRGQEAVVKRLLDTGRVDIHAGRIGSPSAYWYGNRSESKVIRELLRKENQKLILGG